MIRDREKWWVILAVTITGLMKFILADWLELRVLFITASCIFWITFIIVEYRKDPQILIQWGFQKLHLKRSLLFLLPFALICVTGIVLYRIISNPSFFNWHFLPIFVLYPVWGIIQQFIVSGLVASSLRTLFKGKITDIQIISIVSFLFALIHYPGIPLMIYVFVMQFIFTYVYFKYNNLWAPGLYHGWISSFFIFFALGRDLWNELLFIFY